MCEMTKRTLIPATGNEYRAWLGMHLESGGGIDHWYDYPMGDRILIAKWSFHLAGETGAKSMRILVPEGINWDATYLGHNSLYLPEGRVIGSVPIYSNECFHDLPGYREGMSAARERRREFGRLCGQGE